MAYVLEAFLARSSAAADIAAALGSVAVPLDQGIALVPVPDGRDPEDAARRVAGLGDPDPLVFVEAEYWAGVGEQRAVVWRNGLREELGCGVLLVEHDMRIIFRVCERIQVLDHGRSIAVGTPEEIRTNTLVVAAYLGARGAEIAQAH